MKKFLTSCILASCFLLTIGGGPAHGMRGVFLERLANFEGNVPSLWARVAVDKERTEVFALDQRERSIRVFNEHGMEIFVLGDNVELSGATDIDIGEEGNIYVVYPRGEDHKILLLDYKGEPLTAIGLKNFPDDFQQFSPSFLQYRDGMLYLADSYSMDVVVTDTDGVFQKGYHLKAALWGLREEFRGKAGEEEFASPEQFESVNMFGFWADGEGNIFFTVPTLFIAIKMQVDGEMKMFGIAGGAIGKFGVIAGIGTDKKGNIYITDRLRCVVMIFDRDFNFQTEFGYRGIRDGNLVVPDDVVINDEKGLVYVAQAANRGVSVFRIIED